MKVLVVILGVLATVAFAEPPAYRQQNQQQRRYYFARQEEAPTASTPAEAPYAASGWKPAGPSFELPQRQVENSYGAPISPVQQQYGAPESRAQEQPQENQQQYQGFWNSQFQTRQQQEQRFSGAAQNQNQQRQYIAPVVQPQINQYGVPEPQEQFQPPQPGQEYGAPFTTTEEPTTTTEIEEEATTTAAPETDSEVEPVNSVNELDEEGDLDEQQAQQDRQRGEYYIALPDGRLQRIQYVSHQDVEAMKYFARIRAENVEPIRGPIYAYSPLQQVQFSPANLRLSPNPAAPAAASNSAGYSPSGKLELQEDAAAAPPLAAIVQYAYDTPSAVVPLGGGASRYSAAYGAPAAETRYLLSF